MESSNLDIGSGPPRFRDTNGKIYHGARPSETITSGGKQKQGWLFIGFSQATSFRYL